MDVTLERRIRSSGSNLGSGHLCFLGDLGVLGVLGALVSLELFFVGDGGSLLLVRRRISSGGCDDISEQCI